MLSSRELLQLWGFVEHPFQSLTAENEPMLAQYFVSPPYLDDVIGSARSPTPVIVFGSRGVGKSAIRIYLEDICRSQESNRLLGGSAIAITIDNFTEVRRGGKISTVTLESHLKVIMNRMLSAALARVADVIPPSSKPTVDELQQFFPMLDFVQMGRLVRAHYTSKTDEQHKTALKGVFTLFSKQATTVQERVGWFESVWARLRAPLYDLLALIQGARGVESLPEAPNFHPLPGQKEASQDVITDFKVMCSMAPQLGISSWYILIDKVDEDEATHGDADASAKLILPLLRSLHVLEAPGAAFKFFLWEDLRRELSQDAVRLDKIKNWTMCWSDEEIRQMIDRRLSVCSRGTIKSLGDISDTDASETIYPQILAHACSSPREAIHILNTIFREHARISDQNDGVVLTQRSVDAGLDDYCRRRVLDLYPKELLHQVLRLTPLFTSKVVEATFKIAQPTASTRISKWTDYGLVERSDQVRSERDPSRLVYQYRIRDPRVLRLMTRAMSLDGAG